MRRILSSTIMVAVLLSVSSCKEKGLIIPKRQPTPIDPEKVGSLSGQAIFSGRVPTRKPISMGGFPGCIHGEEKLYDESVLVSEGKLENVFVYIKEGLEGKVFAVPAEPVVLDQKFCMYIPHVLGMQRYQPLKILNSDSLLHNVHALPKNQEPFNFGMPVAGMQQTMQFTAEEIMVKIKCDVHGWMGAYIGVLDHPYFAVTGKDGTFRIKNVPPGNYVLEAWHEAYGTQSKKVSVARKEAATVDFTFAPQQ